jgi:crotonobetainyl-CoA:carnitine CoA-transferase CaiB-like acyl-CoA transferase
MPFRDLNRHKAAVAQGHFDGRLRLVGEIHVPGLAVKMSATPGRIGPVPRPGEHTDEILAALLDYDAARLESLRAAKIIA